MVTIASNTAQGIFFSFLVQIKSSHLSAPFHSFCFQCMMNLSCTLPGASEKIGSLSAHWDLVLEHLARVSRVPACRIHMREVGRFCHYEDCFLILHSLLIFISPFAQHIGRVFSTRYSLPGETVHHSLFLRSLLEHFYNFFLYLLIRVFCSTDFPFFL